MYIPKLSELRWIAFALLFGFSLLVPGTARSAEPPCVTQTLYSNDFETGSGFADWITSSLRNGDSTASWRGIQSCEDQKVFRYGGVGCDDDYEHSSFTFAQPGGEAGITIPSQASMNRLSFRHRHDFEDHFDGATLMISLGNGYLPVPPAAIIAGRGYNGKIPDLATCIAPGVNNLPVFTGHKSDFSETVVDLDLACNLVTGGTSGCAEKSVRIGFVTTTDCSITSRGWFIDDVKVTGCVPVAPGAEADFYSLSPCRLVDTRLADGPLGGPALAPRAERTFALSGACGIPATARALAVNATVAQPTSLGYLQIYPGDAPTPSASMLNFLPGSTRANNAVTPLASDGTLTLKVRAVTAQPLHFILDVFGYFE
ncbi:MAG TPA: hypothetical protein VJ885_02670 [Thermoanaerobaculia bacterium]|nr:hypothetical protein [Thermoanaerobaculia bacterium]